MRSIAKRPPSKKGLNIKPTNIVLHPIKGAYSDCFEPLQTLSHQDIACEYISTFSSLTCLNDCSNQCSESL